MITGTRAPISIVLADSNPLVLSALAGLFDNDTRFSLAGTTTTAEDFLQFVERVTVQVGIIEWTLPHMGGARLIETLRRNYKKAPYIIVYGQETTNVIRLAMAAGAASFTSHAVSANELLSISVNVASGKMIFPYIDIRTLNQDPVASLSQRERMILCALAKGLTNRELAKELSISCNTVKFHLSNLYEKLGIRSRAQAIAFFYSSKLDDNAML